MSSDIISVLQLDKKINASRVLVAKEINGCDSSFIISCVLGHFIKKRIPVFIILTHNSLLHYQNVGLKMNYNLQKHIDSGLVHFYNLGEVIVNNLIKNEDISLKHLCGNITESISSIIAKHESVNVILDGISHLFDLQYTLKEVNNFCNEIITLLRGNDNSFVLCHCNVASDDDVTYVMANLLAHKAQTVLEVESLSSGWSADVSGHLIIKHNMRRFEDEHMFTLDLKPSRYLFKLFDRGVKLFAPGTV